MSRLVSKLQSLSKSAAPPIGFRPSTKTEKATMLLIAGFSGAGAEEAKLLNSTDVDAGLILESGVSMVLVKQMVEKTANVPIGFLVEGEDEERLNDILACKCDFLVFDIKVPASMLHKQGIGKFLSVESSLDLGSIKAINSLDIDGVFISNKGKNSFVTVEQLLAYRKFIELLEKPVVVVLPCLVGAAELNELWQLGVDGIVIPAGQPVKALTELRNMVNALPRRTRSRQGKMAASLPSPGALMAEEEDEEI